MQQKNIKVLENLNIGNIDFKKIYIKLCSLLLYIKLHEHGNSQNSFT